MWRRFLPKLNTTAPSFRSGGKLSAVRSLEDANKLIDDIKAANKPVERAEQATHYRELLLAQTPRAALAQIQMDKHKHGYHNREKRLYELIDFNDTFVNLVLATPHGELKGFADKLYSDMSDFCRRLNTTEFTPEQYDAIVRGLSREIAIYRAAIYMGFKARMTSRTEDAFGIDMVIIQPETRKELNIDCKAPPAFRHRLEELVDHGRISDTQLIRADKDQYITNMQHRNEESVPVTLLCVGPDSVGDIHDFTLDHPEMLKDLLNRIFATID